MEIAELQEHPLNKEIYGVNEELSQDFLDSIQKFGVIQPIVVSNLSKKIISGHRRFKACQELNILVPSERAPIAFRDFDDALQEEEALIESNRQREKTATQIMHEVEHLKQIYSARAKQKMISTQNNDAGRAALSNLDKPDVIHTREEVAEKVGLTNGTLARLETVFEAAKSGDEKAKELMEDVDAKKRTINSAYTQLRREEKRRDLKAQIEATANVVEIPEGVQIGDAFELLKQLPDKSIDAVLTSPPFKDEDVEGDYYEWFNKLLKELERVTIDYIIVFNNPTRMIELCRRTDPFRILIWNKGIIQYPWRYEPVFIYKMPTARYNITNRIWTDILPYQPPDIQSHPYENPSELYKHLAGYLEAKTILDPFLGSGTTLKVCKELGIRGLGYERDPQYIPLIKNAGVGGK